jgi:hypothetical protein
MKKLIIAILVICSNINARADEGMWLPFLISQNYAEMQKLGFKLTPQDLYDANKSSIKDAIVHFNGGCTGEIISKDALLLTNHHCGYDAIATLSTVEKNYLMNGFAATRKGDELPCKGLFVKFLIRVEDITDVVMKATKKTSGDAFEAKFKKVFEKYEAIEKAKGYEIDIKPFYAGNKYYMMVFERFNDVRLVATPSESMGKFGGDTDNWMWPRHTCDFSMFRVYSNAENRGAAYNKNNRPYQPKHHLPVSIKPLNEGDFAMVYGYPGRTTRYLTSYGVDLAINETNPSIVKIRDKKLSIMRAEMNKDQATNLKYASSYASIANYWKYFIGQTEQLKAHNILSEKQKQENEFVEWAAKDKKLISVFNRYKTTYDTYRPFNKHGVYYREALMGPALTKIAAAFYSLEELYTKKETPEKIAAMVKRIKGMQANMLDGIDLTTDKKLFSAMNMLYYQDVPKEQLPSIFGTNIFNNNGKKDMGAIMDAYTEKLYSETALLDTTKMNNLLANINATNISNDPAIKFALNIMHNYKDNYEGKAKDFNSNMFELNREYQGAMMKKNEGQLMYPDANSTMRLSYGSVKAYQPKDAVSYNYVTTLDGLLEKYKAGDAEFDLPAKVIDLIKRRDYGDYADKKTGSVVTCFISNNDITGGNSGSPVINGNGELIGAAFDGNWEAMSGDISFDKRFKRTIVADSRYILWVLDKVLDGKVIVDEMTLRK